MTEVECPYCHCIFDSKNDCDWHIALADCDEFPDDEGDEYFGIKRDEDGDVIE